LRDGLPAILEVGAARFAGFIAPTRVAKNVQALAETADRGVRWQPARSKLCEAGSAAATPLLEAVDHSQSGVARRFPPQSKRVATPTRAFSLIELVVVMALLSFIVLGLMAVFNQTQRAFKLGMSQVDVLESGRAMMDLITRDLGQMSTLTGVGTNVVNLRAEVPRDNSGNPLYQALEQELPGSTAARTNVLQEFFFVSRVNQDWIGTGYFVNGGADGMGRLYRYSTNIHTRNLGQVLRSASVPDLYELYKQAPLTECSPVANGVIHLSLNTVVTNGCAVTPPYVYEFGTNRFDGKIDAWYEDSPTAFGSVFLDKYLPLSVEVELAVVEPDLVERIEALPAAGNVRRQYLEQQAEKVHVFRQVVPIREANPDVYR